MYFAGFWKGLAGWGEVPQPMVAPRHLSPRRTPGRKSPPALSTGQGALGKWGTAAITEKTGATLCSEEGVPLSSPHGTA